MIFFRLLTIVRVSAYRDWNKGFSSSSTPVVWNFPRHKSTNSRVSSCITSEVRRRLVLVDLSFNLHLFFVDCITSAYSTSPFTLENLYKLIEISNALESVLDIFSRLLLECKT